MDPNYEATATLSKTKHMPVKRWRPSVEQLQILRETLDEESHTPFTARRRKEIVPLLNQYGPPVTDRNVMRWCQSRRRKKRALERIVSSRDGDTEVFSPNRNTGTLSLQCRPSEEQPDPRYHIRGGFDGLKNGPLEKARVKEIKKRLKNMQAPIAETNAKFRGLIATEDVGISKGRQVMVGGDKGALVSSKVSSSNDGDSYFTYFPPSKQNTGTASHWTPSKDQANSKDQASEQLETQLQNLVQQSFFDEEEVTPDEARLQEIIPTFKNVDRPKHPSEEARRKEIVAILKLHKSIVDTTFKQLETQLQIVQQLDDQEKACLKEKIATFENVTNQPVAETNAELRGLLAEEDVGISKGRLVMVSGNRGVLVSSKVSSSDDGESAFSPPNQNTRSLRCISLQERLQILNKLYDQEKGTPDEARLKEIVATLNLRRPIAETNAKLSRLIEDGGISKKREVMIDDRVVVVKFRRPHHPRSEGRIISRA